GSMAYRAALYSADPSAMIPSAHNHGPPGSAVAASGLAGTNATTASRQSRLAAASTQRRGRLLLRHPWNGASTMNGAMKTAVTRYQAESRLPPTCRSSRKAVMRRPQSARIRDTCESQSKLKRIRAPSTMYPPPAEQDQHAHQSLLVL